MRWVSEHRRAVRAGTTASQWTEYLSVGNALVGMRVINLATESLSTRYFHTDHLGSVAVITDENGVVVERLSYDAWGKRRHPDGTDDPTGSITSQTTRGFTGHEMLGDVGLVHMNGRVYDPLIGRMTSADPTVPDPLNGQAWNRYSYVGNDPLAFTDPSGFSWLSSFFHSVVNFFIHNPIVKAIVQIGINFVLNLVIPGAAFVVAAVSAAIVTGLSGGNLGQALKAAVIAGATAFAFYEVGNYTGHNPSFGTPAYAENIAGHALVGCASSAASGGSCESGALSGAVTAGAGPLINGQSFGAALAENAVLGGVASVAGGGKFENGAITGAFGYLFNNLASDWARAGALGGAVVGGGFAAGACDVATYGACVLATPGTVVAGAAGGSVMLGLLGWAAGTIGDWAIGVYQAILGPDTSAVGQHTTWKTDPETGEIIRTETWVPNPQNPSGWDSEQATDLTGSGHFDKKTQQDVPTPHTHLPDGSVRPATPDEIPQ